MSEVEARLAALCAAAGYPAQLRERIARATFPRLQASGRLDEAQLGQLAEAVKLLVQAGLTAPQVERLLAICEARAGERWRELFWRRAWRLAAWRAADTEPRRDQRSERSSGPGITERRFDERATSRGHPSA